MSGNKNVARIAGRHMPIEEWAKYSVAQKSRLRSGVIYDTVTYAGATGHTNLSFFNSPAGKELDKTNIITAGKLPAGWSMFVRGVQVLFTPGVAVGRIGANAKFDYASDMAAFYNGGLLEVKVGQDVGISDGPLALFPGESRLVADLAYGDTFTADDNKAGVLELVTLGGKQYDDFEPFPIFNTQDFSVTLKWPTAKVPMPSTLDGTVRIRLLGDIADVKS